MDINYYKILEIDKDASPEIVEKAYKTLVMKYHPDLQENSLKTDFEEKLKLINEAYATLSNEEKRKNYDLQLQEKEIEKNKLTENLLNENKFLKEELNNIKQNNNFNAVKNNQYLDYEKAINEAREKAYNDAYIQDLKNRGYKIKYKKTFKDYLKNLIALLLTLIIIFLIFQIPFINDFFNKLIGENVIINAIKNLFS